MSKNPAAVYIPNYLDQRQKRQFLDYLFSLHPIWEMRFSKSNPPPEGSQNRQLLRPVYWLGNWQFACLNYYHPPKGIENRCVLAEKFPEFMQDVVDEIEARIKAHYDPKDIPYGWKFNTCLINYYGQKLVNGKWEDVARVGEHKDFEPGPVASLSFGERALFQFVKSASKEAQSQVIVQQWLEDSSLQFFGGDKFKKQLFHRVQRVENKLKPMPIEIENFETRRINLTFRFVPDDHIVTLKRLPANLREDVMPYVSELAKNSDYFAQAIIS